MEMICILCPKGCHLAIEKENEDYNISGFSCKRGETYAITEFTDPKRIVTSTITIRGNENIRRVSVKTDKPISKDLIFSLLDIIHSTVVKSPLAVGDKLLENVLNTDINIVATRTVP